MASGSSGRGTSSGTKPFDFASDDILCSYEDYGNQDANNGTHADSSIAHDSSKEFSKSRMSRSSVFPTATYNPPEESSFNQSVVSTVENTVKKYTDNLLRFLEGISSRLSQLELYCYNLDKSIGEMRSDLVRDHSESESKLNSLEKHMQEVHRSVQILRDKQELSDTQKELAKLQLAQKESSSCGKAQQNNDRTSVLSSEAKKTDDNSSDSHDQKLALALPHQVAPSPSLPAARPHDLQPSPAAPSTLPPQTMGGQVQYYLPQQQMPGLTASSQPTQAQYQPNQSQGQELIRMGHPQQSQINQSPMMSPYQQQWMPQQLQQPAQPPQQAIMQPQIRTPYPPYLSGQTNPAPSDMAPGSIPMQGTFSTSVQPGSEMVPYSYGSSGRPVQQQQLSLSQHLKPGYGVQPGDGYNPSGQRSPLPPPGNTYMIFDGEAGRTAPHHTGPQPHYQQGPYPPTSFPQRITSPNMVVAPQSSRSHPYNELIEKLVGMGYRGEHVVGVIQRIEESGQPVDFNSVLDRLNGGGSQRGWSN